MSRSEFRWWIWEFLGGWLFFKRKWKALTGLALTTMGAGWGRLQPTPREE